MFTAVEIFDLNVLLLPVCQGLAQVHSIFVGLEDEFALDSLGHASAFLCMHFAGFSCCHFTWLASGCLQELTDTVEPDQRV
jgi:hypothetical protein